MPVPYTPPEFVPPERTDTAWDGPERRSRDPVDRLGRSLNRLCLEAADPYEIVANLEALGYNSVSAVRRVGATDKFALGEALFARTPKSRPRATPVRAADRDLASPLAMVAALAATLVLGTAAAQIPWAPVLFVLVWSQAAATLVSRAHGDLGPEGARDVLSVAVRFGVAGVVLSAAATAFTPAALASATLWLAVAALLWNRRPRLAVTVPVLSLVALGVGNGTDAPPADVHGFVIVLATLAIVPTLAHGARSAGSWIVRRAGTLVAPVLYGVGQAVLIVAILERAPQGADVLAGALLLVAILALSRTMFVRFKAHLTRRLWTDTEPAAFARATRSALLLYVGAYLLPVAVAALWVAVAGPQAWAYHWTAFALYGVCLALAVVSLTFADARTPAVTFLAAGAAALFLPVLLVCAGLAATQLALLLARSRRFEPYAVHLL